MHYYRFNIGDYRRSTGHLSLLEHGIYRSLIDTYYKNECPLDADTRQLMRMHGVRTDDEKTAFMDVLGEFFVGSDEGFKHSHCDQELSVVYAKSESARSSARKRWADKERTKDADAYSGDANACIEDANALKNDAPAMLPSTQYPVPNTKDKKTFVPGKPKTPDCPHQKIIDLYHEHCPVLAQVKVWNDKRKKHLLARWREDPKHQDLKFWEKYFKYVNQSDHLTGKNDRGWTATLEWLINPSNFAKVIEGNYQSKSYQPKNAHTETDQEYLDRVNAALGDDF